MRNDPNSIWNKRLPAAVNISLFVLTIGTITYLTGNVVLFGTKAAVGTVPKKVQVTNITDHSFTVTYMTDELIAGAVTAGTTEKFGTLNLDDRDLAKSPGQHRMHHITIQNITPMTRYYFAIVSGGERFLNNSLPYEVVTAPTSRDTPTSQPPAHGQISLDNGQIPVEGIVYISTETSQMLSALLKPDGSYTLPLNTILRKDLSSIVPLTAGITLHIVANSPTLESQATVLAGQVDPIPRITLSRNYDFTSNDRTVAQEASGSSSAGLNASGSAGLDASGSATIPGFPNPQDTTQVTSPTIISPLQDAILNNQQPVIKGKALPSAPIEITLQSQQEIKSTIQADTNGNWEFQPTSPLDPGQYTVTIKSPDAQGTLQTVTQSFTVNAQGSQFPDPSVSPVKPKPSPTIDPALLTPTASPVPVQPTVTPSVTPTAIPSPTINPLSLTPAQNPNGDGSASSSGSRPIGATGSSTVTVGFFGVMIAIGIGALIFIFI